MEPGSGSRQMDPLRDRSRSEGSFSMSNDALGAIRGAPVRKSSMQSSGGDAFGATRSPLSCNWTGTEGEYGELHELPFGEKWAELGEHHAKFRVSKWETGATNLHQSASMLHEQCMLDERKNLHRSMTLEGAGSPLRRHVTTKIKARLMEEQISTRDEQGRLDIDERCNNIRKHLGCMQASRRDLSEQKRKAEDAIFGPRPKEPEALANVFGGDMFKKQKARAKAQHWDGGADETEDLSLYGKERLDEEEEEIRLRIEEDQKEAMRGSITDNDICELAMGHYR